MNTAQKVVGSTPLRLRGVFLFFISLVTALAPVAASRADWHPEEECPNKVYFELGTQRLFNDTHYSPDMAVCWTNGVITCPDPLGADVGDTMSYDYMVVTGDTWYLAPGENFVDREYGHPLLGGHWVSTLTYIVPRSCGHETVFSTGTYLESTE